MGPKCGAQFFIPIAVRAPLLTVYDHFHSVLELLLHSQGLRVVESPGLGTRELGIVNRFLFCQTAIAPQKGNLLQTHAPDLPRKNHPVGGEDFQKCYKKLVGSSSFASLCFGFATQDALPSFFSFQIRSFQGPTLWPHTLAPPPPELIFGGGRRFGKFTSEAHKLAVREDGRGPCEARKGGLQRERGGDGGGGGGGGRRRLAATCARLHLGWTSLAA